MKYLYIIRHSKSDWKQGVKDFDRTLNKRGEKQSLELGEYFKRKHINPDLIICSAAKRTLSTSLNISKVINYPLAKIQQEPSIYEAHCEKYLPLIWGVDNTVSSVFIIGHNPGVSNLVYALTGDYVDFKTSCVAKISFNTNKWEEVIPNKGNLKQFITPSLF